MLLFSPSQSFCLLFDSAKDIKHKISFLLQKTEHQTAEPKPEEKSPIADAPAAAAAAAAAKRSADFFTLWFDWKTRRLFVSGSLKRAPFHLKRQPWERREGFVSCMDEIQEKQRDYYH